MGEEGSELLNPAHGYGAAVRTSAPTDGWRAR